MLRVADAVVLDGEPVVEAGKDFLQPGQGVERCVQRLVAVGVAMDRNSGAPERQHALNHLVPGHVVAQTVAPVQVAREIHSQ